jgi:hypothetical protein
MKRGICQGIVMKVTEQHIVILGESGAFHNLPRSRTEMPRIGQTYRYRPSSANPLYKNKWLYSTAASVFVLAIALSVIFSSIHPKPYYMVAVDINPSMEIYADERKRITDIVHLNKDSESLINKTKYEGQDLMSGLEDIIVQSAAMGFIKADGSSTIAASMVHLQEKGELTGEDIYQEISNRLAERQITARVVVSEETEETVQKAKQLAMSLNKYTLIKKLQQQGIIHEIDDIKDQSVPQLLNLLSKDKQQEGPLIEELPDQDRNTENKPVNTEAIENKPASDKETISEIPIKTDPSKEQPIQQNPEKSEKQTTTSREANVPNSEKSGTGINNGLSKTGKNTEQKNGAPSHVNRNDAEDDSGQPEEQGASAGTPNVGNAEDQPGNGIANGSNGTAGSETRPDKGNEADSSVTVVEEGSEADSSGTVAEEGSEENSPGTVAEEGNEAESPETVAEEGSEAGSSGTGLAEEPSVPEAEVSIESEQQLAPRGNNRR